MASTRLQTRAELQPDERHVHRTRTTAPPEPVELSAPAPTDAVAAIANAPAGHSASPRTAAAVQRLQRTYGNRAVQRLLLQRQEDEEEVQKLQRQGDEEEIQTLAAPIQRETVPVQRMSIVDTDWSAAKSVRVSEGGGTGGVLIFDDGSKPVVVKPGQSMAPEILLAATLGNATLGESSEKGWTVGTPEARAASDREASVIKARATTLLGDKAGEKRNADALAKLDSPTTVVFSHAGGSDFIDLLKKTAKNKGEEVKQPKQTKKGFFFGRNIRSDSAVADLWKSPGPLKSLGKAAAVDVFMGNGDRLISSYNPENWKVDRGARAIHLIDNVQAMSRDQFTTDVQGRSAHEAFQDWAVHEFVKQFAADDFAPICDPTMDSIMGSLRNDIREKDKQLVGKMLTKQEPKMREWFLAGMVEGKRLLMAVLNNPDKLVGSVSGALGRREVLTNIYARRFFLQGLSAASAWTRAEYIVGEEGTKPSTWKKALRPSGKPGG